MTYFCKLCGTRVGMCFDHVGGKCTPQSTEDDCPGTFVHRMAARGCPNAFRELTHEMVEERRW